ncbi:hypothetical protein FNV43_RR22321 [Rhamnella rubrinervis]|uniref:DUF642 domain-containing protein n=1 Tax=Rhamnella rubrinervis TaxID=2594499 RepID=A0A8K0GR00_9ROSA|nr:hypothetical protein FNV43_RR22321 [Rhamnella rubrinervis]
MLPGKLLLPLLFLALASAASQTIALPDNGHAIQLGEDGKINQTFIANTDYMYCFLTFTVVPGDQNCSDNADIVVAAPDSRAVFSLKQHYGKEAWVSYGQFLGRWDEEEPINLVIQSQTAESNSSSVCWPVIDNLLLKSIPKLIQGNSNLLLNEGFEYGPEFPSNSTDGILIDPAQSPVQSPLQEWSVLGTMKFINSKHFFVPHGNAAIELLLVAPTGIQTAASLTEGSTYDLGFKLGDANNSCAGDFVVAARAGSTLQNFTLLSNGTGSSKEFLMKFRADSGLTLISFQIYTTSQTKDGALFDIGFAPLRSWID